MADDYGMGATLGIIGAGVSLVALRGLVGTVQGMSQRPPYKKQKKYKRQPVQVYRNRFAFSPPARFHL